MLAEQQKSWDGLVKAIQHSHSIQSHLQLYQWLRKDFYPLMRHEVLLSAWGDFSSGELQFDVCAQQPELSTVRLLEDSAIVNYLMCNLYKRWLAQDEKWFVVNHFDASGIHAQSPNPFTSQLMKMHSLLVYGVRDKRGKADCIYVFMDHTRDFDAPQALLGMVMPHLDAALRRISHLPMPSKVDDMLDGLSFGALSEREHEILHWVRSGKTNLEIGIILNISANTVKNHLKRIFQKLDVSCRAQAVAKTGTISRPSAN